MKQNIHSKSWTLQSGNTNNGGAVIWATIGGDILFSTIPSTNSGSSQIISDDTLRSHVNLKLGADGTLMAKEIKVTLAGWPDYVFEESYNQMSLSETEHYITAIYPTCRLLQRLKRKACR